MLAMPARIDRQSHKADAKLRCPGHRAFVRLHACAACASTAAIECAHVRIGTGGGTSIKPADRWCIPLCHECHAAQHAMGERSFEEMHWPDHPGAMRELAEMLAKADQRNWPKLREMP